MNQNNLKTMWEKAHATKSYNTINRNTISAIIHKPHGNIISKIMKELKLKILLYMLSLMTLIGIMLYGFGYLEIQLSTSLGTPFILAGVFLLFKIGSEVIRFLVLNIQKDNLPIKEATLYFSKRLRRINKIDFYIHLSLFYSMATAFLLGYLFDISRFKSWTQSANLSGLLLIFIFLLIITPWLINMYNNQRYNEINKKLKNSMVYLADEGAC